jgi:hypothetical protein
MALGQRPPRKVIGLIVVMALQQLGMYENDVLTKNMLVGGLSVCLAYNENQMGGEVGGCVRERLQKQAIPFFLVTT